MNYGIVGYSGRMGQEIAKAFDGAGHACVLTSDLEGVRCNGRPEVVVDFSSYKALPQTLALCREHGAGLVIGTTALREEDFRGLKALGGDFPVVQSFNFAIGVNILRMLLREAAPMMSDWDLEICEIHHNKKKDAPSGTAILLREATGRDCPTHSLRLGGIPGDHSVYFANEGELLTFAHRALSRSVFALGALKAALFAQSAKAGFYSFEDVLRSGRDQKQ